MEMISRAHLISPVSHVWFTGRRGMNTKVPIEEINGHGDIGWFKTVVLATSHWLQQRI